MESDKETSVEREETKPLSVLDEAKQLNTEMRANLEELRAERKRIEELRAADLLGGRSGNAEPQQQKQKEESPAEYAARIDREIAEGKLR